MIMLANPISSSLTRTLRDMSPQIGFLIKHVPRRARPGGFAIDLYSAASDTGRSVNIPTYQGHQNHLCRIRACIFAK